MSFSDMPSIHKGRQKKTPVTSLFVRQNPIKPYRKAKEKSVKETDNTISVTKNTMDLRSIPIRSASPRNVLEDSSSTLCNSSYYSFDTYRSAAVNTARSFCDEAGLTSYERGKSLRKFVIEIEQQAKLNLPAPVYVSPLENLPSKAIVWDGDGDSSLNGSLSFRRSRSPRATRVSPRTTRPATARLQSLPSSSKVSRSKSTTTLDNCWRDEVIPKQLPVVIDVIGCQQSKELILSRSDSRFRKCRSAMSKKQQTIDDKEREKEDYLVYKNNRHVKYMEYAECRALQTCWFNAIVRVNFVMSLAHIFKPELIQWRRDYHKNKCVRVITRFINLNYRLKSSKRIVKFHGLIRQSRWIFLMHLRIFRKKLAMKRIVPFINQIKGISNRLKGVVKKFIKKIRVCQHFIRKLLSCTKARIVLLEKIWNLREKAFIKSILQVQFEIKNKSTFKTSGLDRLTRLEIQSQATKWQNINDKIDKTLDRLRREGAIEDKLSEDDYVESLMISRERKREILFLILQSLRKEHMLSKRYTGEWDSSREKVEIVKKPEFCDQDAVMLLRGNFHQVNRNIEIAREKSKTEPFMMLKFLNPHTLTLAIKQEHSRLKTFSLEN